MSHRNFVSFVLGMYSLVMMAVTLGKSQFVIAGLWKKSAHRTRKLELIPFGDFFHTTPWWGPITNFIANVGLFLPFGMLLAMLLVGDRNVVRKVTITSAVLSLGIEISQYIFRLGFTDIDDLMLNTLGGYLGARIITHKQLPKRVVTVVTLGVSILLLALLGIGSETTVMATGKGA